MARDEPFLTNVDRDRLLILRLDAPGKTGLQIAQQVSGRFSLGFVTAFASHAICAFEFAAREALADPGSSPARSPIPPHPGGGVASPSPSAPLAWITASSGGEVKLIKVEDVCYFRAEAKYTSVVTASQTYLIRRSLAQLIEDLDPRQFWRIHRSTIVNVDAVAAVTRDLSGATVLKLRRRPERLDVSERYRRLFRQM